jgi:hypothetical protein
MTMSELDGICHDKHASINIDIKTRERLQTYLLEKAPRGQGYSAFIEQALDIFGADKADGSKSYGIGVWEDYPDIDEPMVDGYIQLTDEAKESLEASLARFTSDGVIIRSAVIERSDPPRIYTPGGVFRTIVETSDDEELRALWEGVDKPVA